MRPIRFVQSAEGVAPIRLRASLTLEEEFSDNIKQERNNRQSELRTSIAPGLAAHLEGFGATLDLAYALRFFAPDGRVKDASLDQNALSALGTRLKWDVSPKLQVSLAEDFTKSNDFRDVGEPGTRRTGVSGFIQNRGTMDAAYLLPAGRAGLSYSNVLVRSDAPEGDDSDTHIARMNGGWAGPSLSFGGSYGITRGEFKIASPYWEHSTDGRGSLALTPVANATLSARFSYHDSEQAQDFMLGGARLGGTLALGPEGSLAADAGGDVFAPLDASPRLSANASVVWNQRFSLFSVSATYLEGFTSRFQAVDNTGVARNRSATIAVTSLAFRDLSATLGVNWTENRFEQTTVAGGPAGTVDRTWNLDAGIRYLLARSLVLSLQYALTIRTSTIPTAEFLENRVRLGLSYQHDLL
jgi:hypothetical protein